MTSTSSHRSSRRIVLEEKFIPLDIDTARFWKKANKGNWRGDKWADVVRRAENFKARGMNYEIRWFSSHDRRDQYGDGEIQVIKA
jgi:hypothetical protein